MQQEKNCSAKSVPKYLELVYEPDPDENDGYEVPNLIEEQNSSETEQNYSDSGNNNSLKRNEDHSDSDTLKNCGQSAKNIIVEES